jgi:predicted dehydrogenase
LRLGQLEIRFMNIAILGCGYVADLYATTMGNHPQLKLVGLYDRNQKNLEGFCSGLPARRYSSVDELADDPSVDLVLNLTNPRSHFDLTKRCLEAGKHVYSEKPLAMDATEAAQLADVADQQRLVLSSAPCSLLNDTAQTLWKAIREGVIGKVRLVYANFDDGMIAPNQSPWLWRNGSGVPWPAKDEFEIGCAYEHAGYLLTWLAAFFGPAQRITSFASCQIPDKGIAVDSMAPDFTVGCIEYGDGVVARVTCGLVAPRDKSLTLVGDDGILFVGNVRDDEAPVYLRSSKMGRIPSMLTNRTRWLHRWLEQRIPWPGPETFFQRRIPPARKTRGRVIGPRKPVDFLLGPAELADAIRENRPCRLSARLGVHIVELVEALQHPERFGGQKQMTTTFPAIEPLSWIR